MAAARGCNSLRPRLAAVIMMVMVLAAMVGMVGSGTSAVYALDVSAGDSEKTGTNPDEVAALRAIRSSWRYPPSLRDWEGDDPCSQSWTGVVCQLLPAANTSDPDRPWWKTITGLRLGGLSLSGVMPDELSLLRNLEFLDLSRNYLSGNINPLIFTLPNLSELRLRHNEFTGNIPINIRLAKNLTVLALGFNLLHGKVPREILQLRNLERLILQNNHFYGRVPRFPFYLKKLKHINMAGNNFTHQLPWQISELPNLRSLDLSHNNIHGPIPHLWGRIPYMSVLQLNNNQLNGSIPWELGNCSRLIVLSLQNNNLTGPIPSSLASLKLLNHLSLQNNSLNGTLGSDFSRFPSYSFSGNPDLCLLSSAGSCSNQAASSPPPPSPSSSSSSSSSSSLDDWAIALIVLSAIVLAALLIALVFWASSTHFGKKRAGGWEYAGKIRAFPDIASFRSSAYDPDEIDSYSGNPQMYQEMRGSVLSPMAASSRLSTPSTPGMLSMSAAALKRQLTQSLQGEQRSSLTPFSLHELQLATNHFSAENVISTDGVWRTFSGVLPGGAYVAVKEVDLSSEEPLDSFVSAVDVFSYLHHPNLVPVIGYCAEGPVRLLVYDLVPNGSLDIHLHELEPGMVPLDWNLRMGIAFGVAKGLAFLHSMNPPMTHERLEGSSVILEDNFEVKLIDYCPSVLSPKSQQKPKTPLTSSDSRKGRQSGSKGSAAPELSWAGEHTTRSDMFSFGVLLLELVTGRRPQDPRRPTNEQLLVRWAKPRLTDRALIEAMVDEKLGDNFSSAALYQVALLASKCIQSDPETRPTVIQAVEVLSKVQGLPLDPMLSVHSLSSPYQGSTGGLTDKDE